MTEERPESEPARSGPAESEPDPQRSTESPVQENECPECGGVTIPGSDKCQHCGTPLESGSAISLEMWEWGGALAAGFGFFLTPLLPAPIALYCAYRVYRYKPKAAYGILIVIASSILFWIVLPLAILPG